MLHYSYKWVDKWTYFKDIKFIFPFFMSAVAECVALIIELPIDVIRTRIQVLLK